MDIHDLQKAINRENGQTKGSTAPQTLSWAGTQI